MWSFSFVSSCLSAFMDEGINIAEDIDDHGILMRIAAMGL
jgi:hypothetical protein